MKNPCQDCYGISGVQPSCVRELDVTALTSEEFSCCVRPSIGTWSCSYANELTGWVSVSTDVTPFVLFIKWVYGNDTRQSCNARNSDKVRYLLFTFKSINTGIQLVDLLGTVGDGVTGPMKTK